MTLLFEFETNEVKLFQNSIDKIMLIRRSLKKKKYDHVKSLQFLYLIC